MGTCLTPYSAVRRNRQYREIGLSGRRNWTDELELSSETVSLAERLGANSMVLKVTTNTQVSKNLRLVELSGEEVAAMKLQAGQDIMVRVGEKPHLDGRGTIPVRRRYTVVDPQAAENEGRARILVGHHEFGLGSAWAANAKTGDETEVVGPRGKVVVDQAAKHHVFIGDTTFIGAARAMSGSLPSGAKSDTLLGIQDESDAAALGWVEADAEAEWIIDPQGPGAFIGILWMRFQALGIKPGSAHVYLGGELGLINSLKQMLERAGFGPGDLSAKGYWRIGAGNQDHGEPVKG